MGLISSSDEEDENRMIKTNMLIQQNRLDEKD